MIWHLEDGTSIVKRIGDPTLGFRVRLMEFTRQDAADCYEASLVPTSPQNAKITMWLWVVGMRLDPKKCGRRDRR